MINHVRTYLMNVAASSTPAINQVGEEPIDPDFVPRTVPTAYQKLYHKFYPANCDRLFKNYRTWELLKLMHSSWNEEWLYEEDSRITYIPFQAEDWYDNLGTTVSKAADGPDVYVFGRTKSKNFRLHKIYDVEVAASDVIIVNNATDGLIFNHEDTDWSSSLSIQIPLSNSEISFQLGGASDGDTLRIECVTNPANDLTYLHDRLMEIPASEWKALAAISPHKEVLLRDLTADSPPVAKIAAAAFTLYYGLQNST